MTITCFDLKVPDPINILSRNIFSDKSQLWDFSDWVGFLGGKYYKFPKDFATDYTACPVHHGDFDIMLATAWRQAARDNRVKDEYDNSSKTLSIKLSTAALASKDCK